MDSVSLPLTGMTCAACARTIERTLQQLPGVQDASINFATSRAEVRFDAAKTNVPRLVAAVRDVGYDVVEDQKQARDDEYRTLTVWGFAGSEQHGSHPDSGNTRG